MYLFRSLKEVRDITQGWIREYREERPYGALEDLTQLKFVAAKSKLEKSNCAWS